MFVVQARRPVSRLVHVVDFDPKVGFKPEGRFEARRPVLCPKACFDARRLSWRKNKKQGSFSTLSPGDWCSAQPSPRSGIEQKVVPGWMVKQNWREYYPSPQNMKAEFRVCDRPPDTLGQPSGNSHRWEY